GAGRGPAWGPRLAWHGALLAIAANGTPRYAVDATGRLAVGDNSSLTDAGDDDRLDPRARRRGGDGARRGLDEPRLASGRQGKGRTTPLPPANPPQRGAQINS